MEKGWDASEQLRTLLKDREWTHKQLAEKAGIRQADVSAYATENEDARRMLGITNGRKIAAAFEVTLVEIGAPIWIDDPASQTVVALLQAIEAKLDRQGRATSKSLRALEAQIEHIRGLLEPQAPEATADSGR